ncbi:MAG TPA: acetyl-CoA carboxylase biotin carboxyl carrier protein [Blastocatellia bacterium]|nr:acetyl-CoA carboxylase biotin carboxyl carrier protein [Blastocatellia bacterium]
MNLKELKELIELVSEKGFAEFEYERQGERVRISRFKDPAPQIAPPAVAPVIISPPIAATAESQTLSAQREAHSQPAPEPAQAAPAESEISETQLHIIKSPIVGTFYRSPSPAAEPFVNVGDRVEPDTVVCIIEAMKLMNEIQAEVSGEIAKIYVENGQPVEYGQPLFGIKK